MIRRTLAEVLARGDVHDPELNRRASSVGEVRTSPDLKIATAYVLPLGGQGQEDVLKLLARNKGELRRAVSKKLALKFAPDLRFQLDEAFELLSEVADARPDDTRHSAGYAGVDRSRLGG